MGTRLFVAAWAPPAVAQAFAALDRPPLSGVRWLEPDAWHVTLRFFGPVDDVDAVVDAFDRIDAPACVATVGPAVIAIGKHIVAVPVEGLKPLASAVNRATWMVGQPEPERSFRGHVTIARTKSPARRAAGQAISVEWPVDEIALVKSRLDPDRARYETLTTKRLHAAAAPGAGAEPRTEPPH